jgi:UDP-2,3-diacylglucosamine hydrolase
MNGPRPLVLITDAHISRRRGNTEAFFSMLAAVEKGAGDVVFLGDIFDLWIALPRYENDDHERFLTWCRKEKQRRRVGFVEGNHEFFVAQTHSEAFSWCTQHAWWQDAGGRLFCHGDRINRADRRYLAFRRVTKNPLSRLIMRGLPTGPQLAERLKRGLRATNPAFRKQLPMDALRAFAEAQFHEGITRIFVGHFHRSFHYRGGQGGLLDTLPAWSRQGWVSVLHPGDDALQQDSWRALLPLSAASLPP